MNKREEVSVTFQGQKAGGMIRRLFGSDGLDETALDDCELYVQEHGRSVNRSIITETNEDMEPNSFRGKFHSSHRRRRSTTEHTDQALALMKVIDATYQSAQTGKPVEIA